MSFNPTRLNPKQNLSRQSSLPPGAGITHSAIVKKNGGGRSSAPAGEKKLTQHGYSIELFSCADFVTRHEVIHPKNNTGLGVNTTGDRSMYVVNGMLYVSIGKDAGTETFKVPTGNYIHLAKGTSYSLATSGTDGVELHIVESPEYSKNWKQLEPPTMGEDLGFSTGPDLAPQLVRRTPDPRTVAQAQEMAEQADARRRAPIKKSEGTAVTNANSASVVGVNPRPSGPPQE